MTRYYFDLHECGNVTSDVEGIELASLSHVHRDALAGAREIMCAELAEGRLCMSCHIEVHDDTGSTVLTMPFKDAVTITGLAE